MNTAPTPAAPAPQGQLHPSPKRGQVGRWAIWFPIVAAPLAWNLQLLVNVPIASHGCYPHDVPLDAPIWGNLGAVNAGVEVVALLVCVVAGLVAWRNWRRTRDEKPGTAHHLIEGGDGRTRFMAMVGLLVSGLFIIAVGFAAANLVVVPACTG
jgi:hypothetical protein